MFALVGYATRHGSTGEVAERIATTLAEHGATVELRDVRHVDNLGPYSAVVLGSPVYSGAWLGEATSFVRDHTTALAGRPVWLFSVGRLADQGGLLRRVNWPDARNIDALSRRVRARDHHFFPGAIRPERLPTAYRAVFRALGGRYGDFRDWTEIENWAIGIAHTLSTG